MPSGYSFRNRADANDTLSMLKGWRSRPGNGVTAGVHFPGIRHQGTQGPEQYTEWTHNFIYKTPEDGIPKRDGDQCGVAECTPYFINEEGKLTELTDDEGKSHTQPVYNIFEADIEGGEFIRVDKTWLKLVADCPYCCTCDQASSSSSSSSSVEVTVV